METDKHLLELAAKAAGGLDWEWWTSNSYRRLTFKDGQNTRDGGALHAFKNPADGWPDVSMAPGVQDFIERASPKAILALLARIAELESALRPFAAEGCLWTEHPINDERKVLLGVAQLVDKWAEFTFGDLRRAAAAMGEKDA